MYKAVWTASYFFHTKINLYNDKNGKFISWRKSGPSRSIILDGSLHGCKEVFVLYAFNNSDNSTQRTLWELHKYHTKTQWTLLVWRWQAAAPLRPVHWCSCRIGSVVDARTWTWWAVQVTAGCSTPEHYALSSLFPPIPMSTSSDMFVSTRTSVNLRCLQPP
jgi:hypothetical protein